MDYKIYYSDVAKALYKSRGELSLFVESTIQCVVLAYFDCKKYKFSPFYVNQIFSADATTYRNSVLVLLMKI